jgi:hypothetical protein
VAGLGLLTPMDPSVAKMSAEGGISSSKSPGPMLLQAETGSNGRLKLPGMWLAAYSSAERRSMTTRSRCGLHSFNHQGLTVGPKM